MTGEHPKADPLASNESLLASERDLTARLMGELDWARGEIERLTQDRDLWKERHDRERAAHAKNLTEQQKVEAERDRLRAALKQIEALEHTKQSDYKKSLTSWAIAKDALQSSGVETSAPHEPDGCLDCIERSTTLKHCPSSGRIRELVEHISSLGAHTQAAEVESMGAEIERLKLTLQQQHARAVREMERADRLRAALERARNYVWRNQGGNGCAETLKIADEALGTISQVETPVAHSKSQQKRFDATRRAHETSQRHLTASEDAAMQRALERSVTVIHPGIPPEETEAPPAADWRCRKCGFPNSAVRSTCWNCDK